jgi:hypothetical protein
MALLRRFRSALRWLVGFRPVTFHDLQAHERILMATLDQVLQKVRENRTVLGSLNTLLDGVREQVNQILAGTLLPPGVQAKIDEIFNEAQQTGQELADVVLENTPASPPPAP